ncbi:glycosyltransferase family 4 protein [Chloroflexota bacterium]
MKILWVTSQLPCLRSGGQVRQYYLLKYLCQSHSVTIISLVHESEKRDIPALLRMGAKVITESVPIAKEKSRWGNRLRSWFQLICDPWPNYARTYPLSGLRQQLQYVLTQWNPEIIHFESLFVAPLGEDVRNKPWILAEQNVESKSNFRKSRYEIKLSHRLSGWIETNKLRSWESNMLQSCHACVAVSEDDADELKLLAPNLHIFVVPNGVDSQRFKPPNGSQMERTGLLFFGNLDYQPNIDALIYFSREIFPIIQSSHPEITLTIVGPNAHACIKALGDIPGIIYTGFVEDLRPQLWGAAVCVVPLRSGGGTRLKILEAMAASLPVVSTSVGAEGLKLLDGKDLLIADTPNVFAETVINMLSNEGLRHRLAQNGLRSVTELYEWKVITPKLEQLYASIRA